MTASQMQIINVTENEAEINKEVSQLDPVLVFTSDKGFAASWTLFYFIFSQNNPILQVVVTAF